MIRGERWLWLALLVACDDGGGAESVDAAVRGSDAQVEPTVDAGREDALLDAAPGDAAPGDAVMDAAPGDAEVPDAGGFEQCIPLATHLVDQPALAPSEDCAALAGEAKFLCGEHWFWWALSDDLTGRPEAHARLTALIDATDPQVEGLDLSRMYALRGQIAMALMLENGEFSYLNGIIPDFEQAMALDPANAIIPTWKDSMDIALTWRLRGGEGLEAIMERTWANIEACPTGNILSISGTTIGLPLATGIPQRTIELLDSWTCSGTDFCGDNTWRAPYAQPGLAYHFAEAYARVGRTHDARSHLERALAAPGIETWPYRPMVQDTLDHLDEVVAEFVGLGEEGDAFDRMYANQNFGCMFCHTHEPPADRIPPGRLLPPEPDPDSDPDPDPDPPGEGACTNDADTMTLASHPDIGATMGTCAFECLAGGAPCGTACVQRETGLSEACSGCFGEILACTLMHCALLCINPNSPDCGTCQQMHCLPAFEACAGVSPP